MNEREIFTRALELSSRDERAAYLAQACSGNEELKRKVESLLADAGNLGDFLESPAAEIGHTAPLPAKDPSEGPGTVIGNYKLMEQLGEGGMGTVYVALQQRPVKRKVALKIIKPGMDTKEVIARFEAERQALAMMDHPNIAKVLDAGTTELGRPFFVMELVKGIAINEYCDTNRLPVRERLALFIQVCQAIQHAHQKGIIHRDVKPSNVLVRLHDEVPIPKVIDFGVAKALHQQLTERTIYTRFAQVIGTPLYMSPEQAELGGVDIDTRTDVYSLGVLLYELLSGVTPFDRERFQKAAYDEMRKIICEEDPSKPSTRLSTLGDTAQTICSNRGTDRKKLREALRGDLDWIVMKALEKDRTRRYDTALGLANDVQRFLDEEPVTACPPSNAYRLRKFVRRNRAAVIVGTSLTLLLCGGLVGTWSGWRSASQQRDVAQRKTQEAVEAKRKADHQAEVAGRFAREKEEQRLAATRQREVARSGEYVAEMRVIQNLIDAGNLGVADEMLQKWVPAEGEIERRGWEWYYLLARAREAKVLSGHTRPVWQLAWSPEGKRLATLANNNTEGVISYGSVRIWDAESGTQLRMFEDLPSAPHSLVWSHTGNVLAIGLHDGTIQLREGDTYEVRQSIRTHKSVLHLTFAPDGRRCASAGGKTVEIWDVASGERSNKIVAFEEKPVKGIDWSPVDDRLAILTKTKLDIWDVPAGKRVQQIPIENGRDDFHLRWSPDGKRVAVVSEAAIALQDTTIYDVDSGRAIGDVPDVGGIVSSVNWSSDSKLLATGTLDEHGIRIWDWRNSKTVKTLRGHVGAVRGVSWSPNGEMLASVSDDYTVRIWSTTNNSGVDRHSGHEGSVTRIAWSHDGKAIATTGQDRAIRIWDADLLDLIHVLEGHGEVVRDIRWHRNNVDLASSSHDATARVWNTRTGRQVNQLAHRQRVGGVAWCGDRQLATTSGNNMQIWDLAKGVAERRIFRGLGGGTVDVSRDGKLVASVSDRDLYMCELPSERTVLHRAFSRYWWTSIKLSPDARSLAWSRHNLVEVYSLDDRKTLALQGHSANITGLTWSPNGDRIATSSQDGTIRIWETSRGRELLSINDPSRKVGSVAWSPDGQQLAVGYDDGNMRLISAASGYRTAVSPMFDAQREIARLRKARLLKVGGDLVASERQLRALATDLPNDYAIQASLGAIHARKREWTEAARCFEKAFSLAPAQTKPSTAMWCALLQLKVGDLRAYHKYCEFATDSADTWASDYLSYARRFLTLAFLLAVRPDTSDAIPEVQRIYERVLSADKSPDAWTETEWRWVAVRLKKYEFAEDLDAIRFGIPAAKSMCEGHLALLRAQAASEQGNREAALEALQEATQIKEKRRGMDTAFWWWDLHFEVIYDDLKSRIEADD